MEIEIYNEQELTEKDSALILKRFTTEESNVYKLLCPQNDTVTRDKILEYQMPERVLNIARVVLADPMIRDFEVWHSNYADVKDHILLCNQIILDEKGEPLGRWYDKVYILARWGECLESFSVLKTKAIEILKEKTIVDMLEAKAKINAFLENPDLFCKRSFGGTHSLYVDVRI